MNITASAYTDIGGRGENEDFLCLAEDGGSVIAVVADGLGGHEDGQVASRAAVSALNAELAGKSPSVAALELAVAKANASVVACAESLRSNAKTTVAAVWIQGHLALAATVGDTRVYQFRHDGLVFMSRDHSVAQAEVDAGAMGADEVRTSSYRHHLTRALGADDTVRADIAQLRVEPEDALLVCSDGVWGELTEDEMSALRARAGTPADWIGAIREVVTRRAGGRGDNHSAIAVFASDGEEQA